MATYSELRIEVLGNLIDTPVFVQGQVPKYINRALSKLQDKHNFIVQKAVLSATTATSTRNLIAVPANWKEPRGRPYYTSSTGMSNWIDYAPATGDAEGYRSDQTIGAPEIILRDLQDDFGAGNFQIYPLPNGASDFGDGQYRLFIPYWKYLPALSQDSDHNWFTDNNSTITWLTCDATARGFAANEDETRAEYWRKLAEVEWQDILLIDKRKVLAGLNAETLVPYLDVNSPRISR